MPAHVVRTRTQSYTCLVERGALKRTAELIPQKTGKIFIVSTQDVWDLHGEMLRQAIPDHKLLIFPGGETAKRLSSVEALAEEMVNAGGDRSSLVIAFGGGIVNDLGGFLAAIFMRGIPVIQIPTTLLSQVDAGIGGKTGANLVAGKNLIGSFHQPLGVIIDPDVLKTLPPREYRAGLQEIIKHGVIRSVPLFERLESEVDAVLSQEGPVVEEIVSENARIKAEVVSEDEKESDLRRILNFGHTFGHALEAETEYKRFLHGEAVGFGMKAAAHLGSAVCGFPSSDRDRLFRMIDTYGPVPATDGLTVDSLFRHLVKDKKTVKGVVNFVLPLEIGNVKVVSGVPEQQVKEAIEAALA